MEIQSNAYKAILQSVDYKYSKDPETENRYKFSIKLRLCIFNETTKVVWDNIGQTADLDTSCIIPPKFKHHESLKDFKTLRHSRMQKDAWRLLDSQNYLIDKVGCVFNVIIGIGDGESLHFTEAMRLKRSIPHTAMIRFTADIKNVSDESGNNQLTICATRNSESIVIANVEPGEIADSQGYCFIYLQELAGVVFDYET